MSKQIKKLAGLTAEKSEQLYCQLSMSVRHLKLRSGWGWTSRVWGILSGMYAGKTFNSEQRSKMRRVVWDLIEWRTLAGQRNHRVERLLYSALDELS